MTNPFSLTNFTLPAQNLLSGLTAAAGVALIVLATGLIAGREIAAAVAVGATCLSIVDTPTPPDHKRRGFFIAFVFCSPVTLAVGLSQGDVVVSAAIVALVSLVSAMVTVYGRSALALSAAMILAMIFAFGTPLPTPQAAVLHALCFTGGAAAYAVYGMLMAEWLESRHQRIAMAGALEGFAAYVRAKAQLYDTQVPIETAYGILIERQVTLMERVEAARNLLFRSLERPAERGLAAALVAALDAFEIILSSQTDYFLLQRQFGGRRDSGALLAAIRAGVLEIADVMAALAAAVEYGREPDADIDGLRTRFAALAAQAGDIAPLESAADATEHGEALVELRATLERIQHAIAAFALVQQALRDTAAADRLLAGVQLADFLPPRPYRLILMRRHLRLSSPIFRYALRLTAAMLCAFAVAEWLTRYFSHGSWILLTVAVIMRASYSATRQRQTDRLVGNLIGCVLAAVALHLLADAALVAVYFVSIGLSHAYAPVRYRITSTAACVMALLMMHFLSPGAGSLLLERLLDTLLGAIIAALFSFLLPYWERQSLPALTAQLLRANRKYARQALKRRPAEQTYRLARKDVFDAGADFAGALRRLAAEPGAGDADLPRLQGFLSANYRMMAQLAALHVLLRIRGRDLDPAAADALLAQHRDRLLGLLGAARPAMADADAPPRAGGSGGAGGEWQLVAALMQRLGQAEAVARQISDLAAGLEIAPLRHRRAGRA
jgi:uncharacterized membrane protein YccC